MRISVVMPLYNKKGSIERAMESVLAQTLGDFELIVVDDGSTDGGADLASAKADGRVRVVRQENGGASAARNRGVREARGDWIAFLDADDRWEPRFLEEATTAALLHPEAVAVFSNILLQGKDLSRPALPVQEQAMVIEDYASFFVAHRGRGISSSSVMLRKDALIACGGFPEAARTGEDTDTWFRLAWEGPVVYLGRVLAAYDFSSGQGLCARSGPVFPLVCDTISARLRKGSLGGSAGRSARRARRYFLQAFALGLAQYGRRAEAMRWLLKALPTPRTCASWLRGAVAVVVGK